MSIHRIGFGFLLPSAIALSLLTPSNYALGQGRQTEAKKRRWSAPGIEPIEQKKQMRRSHGKSEFPYKSRID